MHREITWVHASELADPTPYLDGGELLRTVGMWLVPYFADVGASGLLGLLTGSAAGAFDESMLRPLIEHDASGTGRSGSLVRDLARTQR